ncbi:MAG: hypothetical protein KA444_01825 [Bacteroidia bacterium]|nr:hypothetical protein [Bacteroidia bacterium]
MKFISINDPGDPSFNSQRRSDLERALLLGNSAHQKVKIIFETEQGTMVTETTIWNLTQNYIILKGNVDIPIRAIHRIEFL